MLKLLERKLPAESIGGRAGKVDQPPWRSKDITNILTKCADFVLVGKIGVETVLLRFKPISLESGEKLVWIRAKLKCSAGEPVFDEILCQRNTYPPAGTGEDDRSISHVFLAVVVEVDGSEDGS